MSMKPSGGISTLKTGAAIPFLTRLSSNCRRAPRILNALGLLIASFVPVYAAGPFPDAIEKIIASPAYLHSLWGVAISDVATGKRLYEWNPEKLFAPASTTKLFSSAAALLAFGPDHRFVTRVVATSAIDAEGKLNGNLILRASGDPSLSGRIDSAGHLAWTNHDHTYAGFEDKATLTATDPLSGLDDLAAQVAASGVHSVHDVVIETRLFEKAEGSGSGPSQLTPIVVNDNVVDVLVTPGASAGQPAIVTLLPVTPYVQFDVQVTTAESNQPPKIDLRQLRDNRYSVRGQIPLGHKPLLGIAEVADPAAFARALLIERLKAHHVDVEESEFSDAPSNLPETASLDGMRVVATHTSPPLSEQIKVILKVSHNLGASLLPLLLSTQTNEHTLDSGMKREGELLKQLGVGVDAISFAGGAGGTRADFVTPNAVIQLLLAMSKRTDFSTYYNGLPILGVDGTLVDAVGADSPAKGKVFAKTGTLVWSNPLDDQLLLLSKAMSGYMTASSGRKLAIAVYLNNLGVKNEAAIDGQAKVMGTIGELIYRSF